MSNPSFSNIDQWLFEWKEGNLSETQIEQLELFLLNNPELDVDKDMWEMAFISSAPATYPHQEKLLRKKPVVWYYISGAAALLAISFSLYFLTQNSISNPDESIATATASLNKSESNESVVKPKMQITSTSLKESTAAKRLESTNRNEEVEKNEHSYQSKKFSDSKNLDANHSESGLISAINKTKNSQVQNSIIKHSNQKEVSVNNFGGSEELMSEVRNSDFSNNELLSNNSRFENENPNFSPEEYQSILLKIKPFDVEKLKSTRNQEIAKASKTEEIIQDWTLHRKSASTSKSVFQTKWKSFERTVQRMADNPVALKNLKDPHYHVPGMLANDLNFSSVGTMLATRVQASSRYQWLGQKNEQLQNQLVIDGYAYPVRAGIGVQINQSMYHRNGIQNTSVALTYSPKFSINRNVTIEPAFRFKMGTKRIDTDKFTAGQTVEFDRGNAQQFYSSDEKPHGKSLWYKDLGISLMTNTKWFYVGMQVDNIARHYDNIYGPSANQRAHLQSVITVGTDYESKNHKFGYSPYMVYQNYGKLSEAWLGMNARINWLVAGAAISSNYAPAASIGLKFKHLSITYNADYTKSIMNTKSALSHQLTVRFLTNPSRVGQRLLN